MHFERRVILFIIEGEPFGVVLFSLITYSSSCLVSVIFSHNNTCYNSYHRSDFIRSITIADLFLVYPG